eukprot:5768233-Prymnesium_polylepis.1
MGARGHHLAVCAAAKAHRRRASYRPRGRARSPSPSRTWRAPRAGSGWSGNSLSSCARAHRDGSSAHTGARGEKSAVWCSSGHDQSTQPMGCT